MINNNDVFISDEEEDLCPLCVEEMDISDKNFKPCPCGYQVCQFCYNNIRQNPELNGKCPACRRLYDDESVEYKIVSQEEWKYEQTKQSRKDREKKQKEKEKKENEQANRKHLSGMRVIQKNLVYVVGLSPEVEADELHTILRSEKYFGQYGKILKIVINRRNPPPPGSSMHYTSNNNAGFGVYVTFSKKEEATRCINAIDGTYSEGRALKAAYGTTKYCSSYLRGQPCPNPNCMFLHEPGEEADSYTRQDLSTRQNLKMNNEAFKTSPFQKHASNSQYFNTGNNGHHHENEFVNANGASTSSTNIAGAIAANATNHQPIVGAAPLPATASWASNPTIVTRPAIATTGNFANSSAFPTLAESTTLQQIQQQQQQQQQQQKKHKQNSNQFSDEFNPEVSASSFIDETLGFLSSLSSIDYKIKGGIVEDDILKNHTPLFAFGSIHSTSEKKNQAFNLRLIRSLIPKPQNTNGNELVAELQQLAQQHNQHVLQDLSQREQILQEQPQPQPQQLPQSQPQQQQFYNQQNAVAQALLQQQLLQQQQQQQVQQQAQPQNSLQEQFAQRPQQQPQLSNSQVQQLLLLQQQQQQQQQLQSNDANALLNKLKNERAFASTPPPPGLFNATPTNEAPQNNANVGGTASELLSHLMNGKKISA